MDAKLIMKIFAMMLMLFCLCNRGNAGCTDTLSDLRVTQTATGKIVGGYPEYAVEVVNGCRCTQINVKLLCPGFKPSEGIIPNAIWPDGDGKLCTLNFGDPVVTGFKLKFKYASATKISFAPFSSSITYS